MVNDEDSMMKELKTRHLKEDQPSSKAIGIFEKLAKAESCQLKILLLSCLDDDRNAWKFLSLDTLLSYYNCHGDTDVIKQTRKLLLSDEDTAIRSKAAAFLGVISKWPDPALRSSFVLDKDSKVITQVFQSILLLAGIPYHLVRKEVNRLQAGKIDPGFESIEKITQAYADSLQP